jgi:hypothetical protein
MKLTPVQREVLLALIELYHSSKGEAIKGEDIAGMINKNPGTIRNQMQSLRSLGLVEGVPGPKGGYRPTMEGYQILNFVKLDKEAETPVTLGGRTLKGMTVTRIDLINIPDPNTCRARVHVLGNMRQVDVTDIIVIGPTPVNKLMLKGKVLGRDDISNLLLLEIMEMLSVPKERVMDIASKHLKTVPLDSSIRDVARILLKEGIRGAPVVDGRRPVGVVSTVDVARALAENKEDIKVSEIMSKDIHSIPGNALLHQAIKKMEDRNVSRLIVVNGRGKVGGIITRTDVLCRIASLSKSLHR